MNHPKSKLPTKFGLCLKLSSAQAAHCAVFGRNITPNGLDVSRTLALYSSIIMCYNL